MSKPANPGQPPVFLEPTKQVRFFANLFRYRLDPEVHKRFSARTRELGLQFPEEELIILSTLNTPAEVQQFLNTQVYYNDDHTVPDAEETAMSPRRVLQTARAHCFEGAMFAYAVNYLHGHDPRLLLLEASQDSEHNLVLFQDPETKLLGVNAHSAFPGLDGRPAEFSTIRAIAESYYPFYHSDRTKNPNNLTLAGYSDPFDLVSKFGVKWMGSEEPLWDIYFTYIGDTIRFHYLFDDSGHTHLYPLVHALKERWIQVDRRDKPFVNPKNLPPSARELWDAFWREFDGDDERPRGKAREIEQRFQKLTGTTPLDLEENVGELENFLARGYRPKQLITQPESGDR